MKRVMNLTRAMKLQLVKLKLNPDNWQYEKNTPEGLVLIHRVSGKTRTVKL
jgi:hypothetical protein